MGLRRGIPTTAAGAMNRMMCRKEADTCAGSLFPDIVRQRRKRGGSIMLRHLFTAKRGKSRSGVPGGMGGLAVPSSGLDTLKVDIDGLYCLSRKGLWSIFFFLAASALALHFRGLTLSGSLPAGLMEQLGPTPPVMLVNAVLGVSTICSLIAIAGKIHENRRPGNTWVHLGFRMFFYLLYFIANSLDEYFYVVFISGLAVISLQHYNVWNYCSRAIESRMDAGGGMTACNRRLAGK
jgi:hypothetical protein